jgi:hypothetical protein
MWQIQDHKPVDPLGTGHGERPSHQAAPVVPDDNRLLLLEMVEHGGQVRDQLFDFVVVDTVRLVAQV